MRHLLGIVLLALVPFVADAEARFLRPAEKKALVHRDLLPLETDTIRTLSRHLATLASVPLEEDDAAHNRAVAQLLALALELDPVNQGARRLLKQHLRGTPPPRFPPGQKAESQEQAQKIARWLLSPTAGNAGRRLGQLMVDPLRVLHPELPICQQAGPEGEADRWQGVVPPITAFMDDPEPAREEREPPAAVAEPMPEPPPTPPPARTPLRELSLRTPLHLRRATGELDYFLAPISLTIDPAGEQAEEAGLESFRLLPQALPALEAAIRQRTLTGIRREWEPLPANHLATFQTGTSVYLPQNEEALSGATALLLHAALSRKPLRPDLVVLGEINSTGQFQLPRLGWDYLRFGLEKEGGDQGRLLVPASAEAQIRALLAIERPEFFLAWQVHAVTDLPQALAFASDEGAPPALVQAAALFAEFQAIARTKDLGPLLINQHVRRRLQEIVRLDPNHLSAKMILLQGSDQRPRNLDAETMGLELMACRALIGKPLTTTNPGELDGRELLALEKQCLQRLDDMEKYAQIKHRALIQSVRFTTRRLGQIARASKQAHASDLHAKRLWEGFASFREEHAELGGKISQLLGGRELAPRYPTPQR